LISSIKLINFFILSEVRLVSIVFVAPVWSTSVTALWLLLDFFDFFDLPDDFVLVVVFVLCCDSGQQVGQRYVSV
uniref:Ovule protein n=1 Tax=Schistosoma curassoni TaxID=6186 RepID=A0A183L3X1_9TREM